MTIEEHKSEATRFKKANNFQEALLHYEIIWNEHKNEWNGYYLAQCLRKLSRYDDAYQIHEEIGRLFPHFRVIHNERLWLDYSSKVKDYSNSNYIRDAENIITNSNQYDTYTSNVFIKTILVVARRLSPQDSKLKLEWLNKLDQSILDNKVFRFRDITYPSDRKRYYIEYADALVTLEQQYQFIEKKLKELNFKESKVVAFLKYIVTSYTFYRSDGSLYISRTRLALQIKNIQEEIYLKGKTKIELIYQEKKKTSVSDLSHYLFCPVSLSINNSFKIYANESWEKDEWKKDKLYLVNRFYLFKNSCDFKIVFDDTQIQLTEEMRNQFQFIFDSEIIVYNANLSPTIIFQSTADNLCGAPDYLLKSKSGKNYLIIEKFSHISAKQHTLPYDSDMIKPIAFISAFKDLNLSFGLILNWYWYMEDVESEMGIKKKIVINSYRLTKVESSSTNLTKLDNVMKEVFDFQSTKKMKVDGEKISYPNKCVNCSVISYCNHKTGRFDELTLPYQINSIKQ